MIKLTFDTNCIINVLDYKSESATSVEELTEILRYGFDGDVNIAITTRVENDFNKDKNKERSFELVKRISMFPVIGTVVRLDHSKLDSEDVLGNNEHEALEKELTDIIFPGLKKEDSHFGNKINDIDHLIGHKINKRDIFITDDQQIIKKAETLESSMGIKVMNPKKALEYLNLKGNKLVLAQEFYEKFLVYKELIVEIISKNDTTDEVLSKYEDLRKWLIRKHAIINDGLLSYKHNMSSIPISGQRVFSQDDIISNQNFNKKFNDLLKTRDPLVIPEIISYNEYNYGYTSEDKKVSITINFLNNVEDTLLGYVGKLESN